VLVALAMMTPKPPVAVSARAGLWREVIDGLHYIRSQPAILSLFSLALLMSIVARPYIQLLPAFVKTTLAGGPNELGIMMAASGAGALAGSIATAFIGNRRHRGWLAITCAVLAGIALFVFAETKAVTPGATVLVAVGLFVMLFMGMTNTLLQVHTALEMRGRVMALYTMIFLGFMPFGAWLLGTTATLTSLPLTLAVAGITLAVAGLVISRFPGLRDLA
jgi:predicted MFS family arabinose efflux permease